MSDHQVPAVPNKRAARLREPIAPNDREALIRQRVAAIQAAQAAQSAHSGQLGKLGQQPTTRAIVRQVMTLLFNDFGEAPSVKRIRQLIGKGSFSTISDELRIFWSSVQVTAAEDAALGNMPAHIVQSNRAALSALWRSALEEAQQRAGSCPHCVQLKAQLEDMERQLSALKGPPSRENERLAT